MFFTSIFSHPAYALSCGRNVSVSLAEPYVQHEIIFRGLALERKDEKRIPFKILELYKNASPSSTNLANTIDVLSAPKSIAKNMGPVPGTPGVTDQNFITGKEYIVYGHLAHTKSGRMYIYPASACSRIDVSVDQAINDIKNGDDPDIDETTLAFIGKVVGSQHEMLPHNDRLALRSQSKIKFEIEEIIFREKKAKPHFDKKDNIEISAAGCGQSFHIAESYLVVLQTPLPDSIIPQQQEDYRIHCSERVVKPVGEKGLLTLLKQINEQEYRSGGVDLFTED